MNSLNLCCRLPFTRNFGPRPTGPAPHLSRSPRGAGFGSWLRSSLVLGFAALVLSGSLWLFPASAQAGCNTTCFDQALEAADAACVDTFAYSGLQDVCQASFRRAADRLTREDLRCKQEVLSLKGLVFANCRMSPEGLLPNIEARRCVGQQALVEVLESCDPDFQ